MVKAERYEMKPLFGGVCKCQKWVENANQTQLKPIICYTSWYFSRGGVKKKFAEFKNFNPYRILIYAPDSTINKKHQIFNLFV